MARKDDVKMLFDFMIEMLKEEKQEEQRISYGETPKQLLVENEAEGLKNEETESDDKLDDIRRILNVMKKVDILDKIKSTNPTRYLVPLKNRDAEEDVEKIGNALDSVLSDSRRIMNDLQISNPITPSISPDELDYMENNPRLDFTNEEISNKTSITGATDTIGFGVKNTTPIKRKRK